MEIAHKKILIFDKSEQTGKRIKSTLLEYVSIEWINIVKLLKETVKEIHQPDIVVMDVSAVGMSGYELIRQVKTNHTYIPLILFTNYSSNQYRSNCMQSGADYFLDKTNEFDKLIELINKNTK